MLKKEGEVRIPSGCAIAAITDRTGERFDGTDIIDCIALIHDRSALRLTGFIPTIRICLLSIFSMMTMMHELKPRSFYSDTLT